MKKLAALLLSLLLLFTTASADIPWPDAPTASQSHLMAYVALANEILAEQQSGVIDMAYELMDSFASLGMDGVDIPDGYNPGFVLPVELYLYMTPDGLHKLELRCHDTAKFNTIAPALMHASSPAGVPMDMARQVVEGYTARALAAPTDSFEEGVVELQGAQTRTYFAYYPDQFGDQYNWLQMTLIFPRPGSEGAALLIPATPAPNAGDNMYEGYFPEDNYVHFEYFVTPTPEPDSAAME